MSGDNTKIHMLTLPITKIPLKIQDTPPGADLPGQHQVPLSISQNRSLHLLIFHLLKKNTGQTYATVLGPRLSPLLIEHAIKHFLIFATKEAVFAGASALAHLG